jgi:hypothetical protein
MIRLQILDVIFFIYYGVVYVAQGIMNAVYVNDPQKYI